MLTMGLIVEGEDDRLSYEIIFKRIKPELDIKTFLLHGCDKEKLKERFEILNKKLQESNYSGVKEGLIICAQTRRSGGSRMRFLSLRTCPLLGGQAEQKHFKSQAGFRTGLRDIMQGGKRKRPHDNIGACGNVYGWRDLSAPVTAIIFLFLF